MKVLATGYWIFMGSAEYSTFIGSAIIEDILGFSKAVLTRSDKAK